MGRHHRSEHSCDDRETYDFVIVGAGNAGCVVANRLSESGKFTVCLLEYGRDDAKLQELLPERSTAPVPQPGDFHWGKYTRGMLAPTEFVSLLLNRGFAHFDWYQTEDENGPVPGRSTTYARNAGWGGCTSHNDSFCIRNAPFNWQQWVDLGLTDWDATFPTSNLIKFYKKMENRTQTIPGFDPQFLATPFYNPARFNLSDPNGPQPLGSFPPPSAPQYYGYNGHVPLFNFNYFQAFTGDEFTGVMQKAIASLDPSFNYPLDSNDPTKAMLVDLDWPPATNRGGLSFENYTGLPQNGALVPPPGFFDLPQTLTPYLEYSERIYPGEALFTYPSEFATANLQPPPPFYPFIPTVRASSATTYLYPAQSRDNLTIKSEVLVTKVILSDKKAKGVKYLDGWNIYQTGRNNNVLFAGYGGTAGDARANAILAKQKGEKAVYAKKEVILCAGVFNTPQILQLSGIGDSAELEPVGIRVKHHLPGVGKHLIDNQELFFFFKGTNPIIPLAFAAKSDHNQSFPDFDLHFGGIGSLSQEARDVFIQNRWHGVKNVPAIYGSFVRNANNNILVDTNVNPVDPKDVPFNPIMVSFYDVNALYIEQQQDNLSDGYVKVVSKDPTVPPIIVMNFMSNQSDVDRWINICFTNVFPIMLYLKANNPKYFSQLLDPAPVDFLKAGVTYDNWTDVSQVDVDRLKNFFNNKVGGHHACGTCKMGVLKRDPMSVVDQKGRVYGVERLRVCDASVCPVSIRWPNGTMYIVGEKISADILAKYSC
jgi:choline dehydrogenase-like flavoprotein